MGFVRLAPQRLSTSTSFVSAFMFAFKINNDINIDICELNICTYIFTKWLVFRPLVLSKKQELHDFCFKVLKIMKLSFGNILTYMCNTKQENSAKLTNQRVSCAFTSSPFSFHVRHILPTSKFENIYSCILVIFLQTSVNNMCENCDCECEYSTLVSRFLSRNPSELLHNSYITSTVPGLHFCRWQ